MRLAETGQMAGFGLYCRYVSKRANSSETRRIQNMTHYQRVEILGEANFVLRERESEHQNNPKAAF